MALFYSFHTSSGMYYGMFKVNWDYSNRWLHQLLIDSVCSSYLLRLPPSGVKLFVNISFTKSDWVYLSLSESKLISKNTYTGFSIKPFYSFFLLSFFDFLFLQNVRHWKKKKEVSNCLQPWFFFSPQHLDRVLLAGVLSEVPSAGCRRPKAKRYAQVLLLTKEFLLPKGTTCVARERGTGPQIFDVLRVSPNKI